MVREPDPDFTVSTVVMDLRPPCLLCVALFAACYGPESQSSFDDPTDGHDGGSSSSSALPDAESVGSDTDPAPHDSGDSSTGGPVDPGPQPDLCGDGIEAPSEDCDDGNKVDGDGCDADCTWGGKTRWSVVNDGGVGNDDFARAMKPLPGGELMVVGGWSPVDEPALRILVARYGVDGQRLWVDDPGVVGIGYGMDIDTAGRIIVGGDAAMGPAVRRFDAMGGTDLPVPASDGTRRGVAAFGAARIVQVGATLDGRWIVEAFEDGVQSWSDTSNRPGRAEAVEIAADGATTVVGHVEDPVSSRSLGRLVRYADDGTVTEDIEFDLGRDSGLCAVVGLDEGGYLVAGRGEGNAWVLQLDEAGEVTWSDPLDSGEGDDEAWDVALGPDGSMVVVGTSATGESGDTNAFVARYSADGDFLWWREFSGDVPGSDAARAVVVDDQGRIFVAGQLRVPDAAVDLFLAELSP